MLLRSFRNEGDTRAIAVEIRDQISDFYTMKDCVEISDA